MIYLRLIWSYLKIGLFGFGGGYAMLSLIEREIVGPGWITEKIFTDIVAISQMTPGPIGINSATYIGYVAPGLAGYSGVFWGLLGSIVCTVVVVLPSFLLVTYASHFISKHKDSAAVKGVFGGLRPVVIGLIASAALLLMNEANFGSMANKVELLGVSIGELVVSLAIAAASLCCVLFTKIHPILVIIAAGLIGLAVYM